MRKETQLKMRSVRLATSFNSSYKQQITGHRFLRLLPSPNLLPFPPCFLRARMSCHVVDLSLSPDCGTTPCVAYPSAITSIQNIALACAVWPAQLLGNTSLRSLSLLVLIVTRPNQSRTNGRSSRPMKSGGKSLHLANPFLACHQPTVHMLCLNVLGYALTIHKLKLHTHRARPLASPHLCLAA